MNRTFIFPWHDNSKSVKGLKRLLGIKSIKRQGSAFIGAPNKNVINWGASELPAEVTKCNVINSPTAIANVSNKLTFFRLVEKQLDALKPRIPEFTTDARVALSWIRDKNEVMARTLLTSSSGKGILFYSEENADDFLDAPLFTKYKKKKEEFRIHFAFGRHIDSQKKALRVTDDDGNRIIPENIDHRIRTHSNGFVFIRNDIIIPEDVLEQARRAYNISGLSFGAVDVIWNEHEQKAYVLEINSAPGLEGTTLENYAEAFRNNL